MHIMRAPIVASHQQLKNNATLRYPVLLRRLIRMNETQYPHHKWMKSQTSLEIFDGTVSLCTARKKRENACL